MNAIAARDITGVILAGGQGRRLGGVDKGLVPLHGKPLIEHVIAALQPQVGSLLISANRNREIYSAYGFPVVADVIGDYDGPLAGMLSAMRAAGTPYILTAPCDAPRLPADLAQRLCAALARANADAAVAASGGQMQPVFALLRTRLADELQKFLEAGGRGVGEWLRRLPAAVSDFPGGEGVFMNINTAEELRNIEAMK
jgi:molybdopterin-guanine dinucleotide biosynthesis protein A